MKRIACRIIAIIVLPLLIIGGINYFNDPDYTLNKNYVPKFVNALQAGRMVSGPVNSSLREVKKQWINQMNHSPEIVILGSSRIISLPNVLSPKQSFFNAAVSNCTIQDMYIFLSLLQKKNHQLPGQVIICCDQWLFGPSFSEKRWLENRSEFIDFAKKNGDLPLSGIPSKWEIQKEWISELFSVRYLLQSTPYGGHKKELLISDTVNTSATMLLPDGTRRSAEKSTTMDEKTKTRLALEYCRRSKDEKFAELDLFQTLLFKNLITLLEKQACHIILYLPPYHPETYTYFKDDKQSQGIFKANDFILSFAECRNILVIGATNPEDLNLDSSCFYDAVHLNNNALSNLFRTSINKTKHSIKSKPQQ